MDKLKEFNVKTKFRMKIELKLINLRKAVVSNAIGVIDFLYKAFPGSLWGKVLLSSILNLKMLIIKIGRFPEAIFIVYWDGVVPKFQNYGLVPPIKEFYH